MTIAQWFTRLCVLTTVGATAFAFAHTGQSASSPAHQTTTSARWQFERKVGEAPLRYFNFTLPTLQYAKPNMGIWQIETVDSAMSAGALLSLALDNEGKAHISYGNPTGANRSGDLRYAESNDPNWSFATIDTQLAYPTSLKLDQAGTPHIAYATENGSLKHAWRDTAGWHTETVASLAETSAGALALDQVGRPRIAYQKEGQIIQYAWYDGSTWHDETADHPLKGGGQPALALDNADHPHISYCAYEVACNPRYCITYCNTLNHAWNDGTKWYTEIIASGGEYSSFVFDQENRPHIGYHDNGIKYVWYDGTAWQLETVDDEPYCDRWQRDACLSLRLDNANQPHLAYFGVLGTEIRYAWRNDSGWHSELIDTTSSLFKAHLSLALDQADRAHIAYQADENLRFARQLPQLSLEKQANPERGLQVGTPFTYTLTLVGAGLNATLVDPLPAQVSYIPDSLTQTITPSAVYSSATHTIFWQGILSVDTVQTIGFQVTTNVTMKSTLGLSPPIVNTAWLTDTDHNNGLSATVIVNGSYQYLPLVMHNN